MIVCGESRCEIIEKKMRECDKVVRNAATMGRRSIRAHICHRRPFAWRGQNVHFPGALHSSKRRRVLTQNVPTLTIFTQEWTTNGFGLLLLPFPDTLPRVSVSPELHLFWQAAFLTAFNTSPFTRTLSKERQSIIFEKRIAKHLAGDEWEVTCLIWWNICWRIPKCRSAWANLREFPNLCKKQNLHPRNSKYHSYYLAC